MFKCEIDFDNFIVDCKDKIKSIKNLKQHKHASLALFNWINYGSEEGLYDLTKLDYLDNNNDNEHSPCCTFEEAIRRIERDILIAKQWYVKALKQHGIHICLEDLGVK